MIKTERNPEIPACADVAPLLTVLFDGEADAHSAQTARAHLLSCEQCARTWLDWNQHRAILRNVQVPAPPPTLLWRVLLACRWAAISRGTRTGSAQTPKSRTSTASGLSPLPGDLSSRILAQTTRRDVPAPVAAPASVFARPAKTRRRRRLTTLPAFAVPALAAWLLVLSQNSSLAPVAISPASAPVASDGIASQGEVEVTPPALDAGTLPTAHTPVKPATRIRMAPVDASAKVVVPKLSVAVPTPAAPLKTISVPIRAAEMDEPRSTQSRENERHENEHRGGVVLLVATHDEAPTVRSVSHSFAPEHGSGNAVLAPQVVEKSASDGVKPIAHPVSAPSHSRVAFNPRVGKPLGSNLPAPALSTGLRSLRSRAPRSLMVNFVDADDATLRPSQPVSGVTPHPIRLASLETPEVVDEHVEEVQSAVDAFRSAMNPDDSAESLDASSN